MLGTTTHVESVHPCLRRMDRLGLAVHLQAPARGDRISILSNIMNWNHRRERSIDNDEVLDYIASATPGYLPADLKLLHAEAVLEAVKEFDMVCSSTSESTESTSARQLFCGQHANIAAPSLAQYKAALRRNKPAHLSDISGSLLRPVSFAELGGLDDIVDDLTFTAQLCFERR